MHLGPELVLLNLDLEFRTGLDAQGVAKTVDRVEAAIHEAHPKVNEIFVEAELLTGALES